MQLTNEQKEELESLRVVNDRLGKASFMHIRHKEEYAPLVAAGYVNWTEPHPEMSANFAATEITEAGREALSA